MASFKLVERENWEVNFYCKDGRGNNKKIKKRGFRTKKEASDYAVNYIKKHTGAIDTLFFDVVDGFMEYKKQRLKIKTFRVYKCFYRTIKKYFANKPICDIQNNDIANYLDNIKSPTLQKSYKIILNLVFKYAKMYYNLENNVMNNLEYDYLNHFKKEKQIWTIEEFKKFDKILINENKKIHRAYFNLLFFSGARPGEISALTLEDIDFEKYTINITKTRISSNFSNSTKNRSSIRIISMPKFCLDILKLAVGNNYPKGEYIFSIPMAFYKFLKHQIKTYRLKDISLHNFRHSHASFLIKRGVEITAISKRLGHKNSQMTLSTYAHFYNDKKDKIIDLLNELE